jgi:hypothetical protein
MPSTPDATVAISEDAGALAGGTGYCVIIAAVATNPDVTPRVYANRKGILDQHGYAQGVDYAATHIEDTRKSVIFIGVPIVIPGVVGRQDGSKVTGSCVISAAAGADGALEEVDGIVQVLKAGTIGASGIQVRISMDGGRTWQSRNLGVANSYVIPFVGITLSFGAGDLAIGDQFTFGSTAPLWDGAGITAARMALSAQQNPTRSWMIIGDLPTHTEAGFITTNVNAYETAKKRFTYARAQVRDRLPLASMARITVRMTGAPTLTFAEVGGTGDTITRSAGSWLADGLAVGMYFSVTGSVSNNVSDKIAALADTVMTLGATDLAAEVGTAGCTVVASPALTFAATTCTRSGGGSWLDDGFAVGDTFTSAGTASNNYSKVLTGVSATVLTFGAGGGVAETIGSRSVTITKGELMSAWVAAMVAEFSTVTGQKRINLGAGRLRKASEIHGWMIRRPVQWAASVRSYQHDIHHTTWEKDDGALLDWSNTDEHNNVEEYDQDFDGGLLEGGFTCSRTWGNGPVGPFIAMDLTRDTEGATLQFQHNLEVANIFCTVVQAKTENVVGKTPVLNDDGTAPAAVLQVYEEAINSDVQQALLREFVKGEGPRASKAVWTASTDDILRGVGATLTGTGELNVNGTIVHVDTLVKVR